MAMPGRQFFAGGEYRYGFNGKENDKDVGVGVQDYGMRIYNARLGKFLSVDPITAKYPWYTPYQFAGNMPINSIDLDGLEPQDVNTLSKKPEFKTSAAANTSSNDPIAYGNNAKPWTDLINFRIPINLLKPRSLHATEQTIEGAWGADTNLDYYSVVISKLPNGVNNGGELFDAIRLQLGQFLDPLTKFAGYASDGSDKKLWESKNPLGSIMSFDASFRGLGTTWNLDDASVMTSSYFRNTQGGFWTFSTLSTTGDGYHPIGGTRQFGVSSFTNTDGSCGYQFYIRAADRVYDLGTNIVGQKTVFESAHKTWTALCSNVLWSYVWKNGGSGTTYAPISKRVPWNDVKDQLKK